MKKLLLFTLFLICGASAFAQNAQLYYGTTPPFTLPPAPYEACPGEAVTIFWSGYTTSQINYLEFELKDGSIYRVYDNGGANIPASGIGEAVQLFPFAPGSCSNVANTSPPYCGSFRFTVPDPTGVGGGAVDGKVVLYDTTQSAVDSFTWVIHNPDVSIGGLDPSICSEDTAGITVSPTIGGTGNYFFTPTAAVATYLPTPTNAPWNSNNYDRIFVPNPAGNNNVITGTSPEQFVELEYRFLPERSDGTPCPPAAEQSVTQSTTVYANYPINVIYQDMPETLSDIEPWVFPSPGGVISPELGGNENPVWAGRIDPDIDFNFSGQYVTGNQLDGVLLGSGNNTDVTLSLDNHGCKADATNSVTIQSAAITIPAQYCEGELDTFYRSDITGAPGYWSIGIINYEFNLLEVTCNPYPGAITQLSNTPGSEAFVFNTAGIPGGTIITITFQFYSDLGGSRFNGTNRVYQTSIIGLSGATPPTFFSDRILP